MVKEQNNNNKWYFLYTKSRREKAEARKLEKPGIQSNCPSKRTKRKWSDRCKWIEAPLFSSFGEVVKRQENKLLMESESLGIVLFIDDPKIVYSVNS